jgi:hypothetical protein
MGTESTKALLLFSPFLKRFGNFVFDFKALALYERFQFLF